MRTSLFFTTLISLALPATARPQGLGLAPGTRTLVTLPCPTGCSSEQIEGTVVSVPDDTLEISTSQGFQRIPVTAIQKLEVWHRKTAWKTGLNVGSVLGFIAGYAIVAATYHCSPNAWCFKGMSEGLVGAVGSLVGGGLGLAVGSGIDRGGEWRQKALPRLRLAPTLSSSGVGIAASLRF